MLLAHESGADFIKLFPADLAAIEAEAVAAERVRIGTLLPTSGRLAMKSGVSRSTKEKPPSPAAKQAEVVMQSSVSTMPPTSFFIAGSRKSAK